MAALVGNLTSVGNPFHWTLFFARQPEPDLEFTEEELDQTTATKTTGPLIPRKKSGGGRPIIWILLLILVGGLTYVATMEPEMLAEWLNPYVGERTPPPMAMKPKPSEPAVMDSPAPAPQAAPGLPDEVSRPSAPADSPAPAMTPATPSAVPPPQTTARPGGPVASTPSPMFSEGQKVTVTDQTAQGGSIPLFTESTGNKPGSLLRAGVTLTVLDGDLQPGGWMYLVRTDEGTKGWGGGEASSLEVLTPGSSSEGSLPDEISCRLFRRFSCVIIPLVLDPVTNLHSQDDPMDTLAAIIFDFDGVIADTESLHFAAFRETLNEIGISMSKADYYANYLGYDDRGCFIAALTACQRAPTTPIIAQLMQRKAQAYLESVKDHLVIFPGVREFVRNAAAYPLAIASGALRHEIELILDQAGLRKEFLHITGAEDVDRGKPDPQPFLHALDALNRQRPAQTITSGSCLVIEDSIPGLRGAKTAGMKVLAVANTHPIQDLQEAHAVTHSLEQVSLSELRGRLWPTA